MATTRAALAELAGAAPRRGAAEPVTVSGRFRVTGWPRSALQAVELPDNPPDEIDAVVSISSATGRGTAFLVRDHGRCADLVTNQHVLGGARTARVTIAGTDRAARVLPQPNPWRYRRLLRRHAPRLDATQRRDWAADTDLRVVRVDTPEPLGVAPLAVSAADTGDALALSVGYPCGGVPRFVWPARPVPLPTIGVGRLVRHGADAELWTPWRVQRGNSGGPVLVREGGRLRVAAVTYVQHDTGSRGSAVHIPASVLRAYLAAVDETAVDETGPGRS